MPRLRKLWVAKFYEKKSKHPFATEIVIADSYDEAGSIAEEWSHQKYNGRARNILIEKSKKGEVLAQN